MKTVIGLVGAKGSGKTTTYKFIKKYNDTAQEVTLADKLKNISAQVSGIPRDHFDSHQFKEKELDNPLFLNEEIVREIYGAYDLSPDYDKYIRPHIGKILETPRKIAQYVGTEILRTVQDDIHCVNAVKDLGDGLGVVTDIRFPNEYDFFKANAEVFELVYVRNLSAETTAGGDTHVSEKYLQDLAKKATITLDNGTTLEALETQIKEKLYNYLRGSNE